MFIEITKASVNTMIDLNCVSQIADIVGELEIFIRFKDKQTDRLTFETFQNKEDSYNLIKEAIGNLPED